MRGLTFGRPSATLAYLALAALAFQIALSISAPGVAAWSPSHAHITLDGRDHSHLHVWDRPLGVPAPTSEHQADDHPRSEPAPANDLGVAGGAIALPVAVALRSTPGLAVLARLSSIPALRDAIPLPATPPPRG